MKLSVAVKAKRRTQAECHCATCGAASMPRQRAGGSLPQQFSGEAVLIPTVGETQAWVSSRRYGTSHHYFS